MSKPVCIPELAQALADKYEIPLAAATEFITAWRDELISIMAKGERLELREFGVFTTKKTKPRECMNPRTGEKITTMGRTIIRFKPSIQQIVKI